MGETTGISWTDHTFNPWMGCWKIADECKNCYAETTAARFKGEHGELWGRTAERRFMSEKYWAQLAKWNRKAAADGVRRRVFVGSMCDWAELHVDERIAKLQDQARERLWTEIAFCSSLDFLMLTKRPESAVDLVPWADGKQRAWPNVWMGVTAGTIKAMLENVPVLRTIPAVVHFISCEPLLEDIPAHVWDGALEDGARFRGSVIDACPFPIDWLIVGDESGHHARGAQVDWVRSAREAALRHGVAFHFKQWAGADVHGISGRLPNAGGAGNARKIHLPLLDGKQWAQFPKEQGK